MPGSVRTTAAVHARKCPSTFGRKTRKCPNDTLQEPRKRERPLDLVLYALFAQFPGSVRTPECPEVSEGGGRRSPELSERQRDHEASVLHAFIEEPPEVSERRMPGSVRTSDGTGSTSNPRKCPNPGTSLHRGETPTSFQALPGGCQLLVSEQRSPRMPDHQRLHRQI